MHMYIWAFFGLKTWRIYIYLDTHTTHPLLIMGEDIETKNLIDPPKKNKKIG